MGQRTRASDKPKIVVVGGGTGSFTVLTGLKRYPVDLTAVVAMTDSGGSSGVLRDEFGHLPPGDVRQCLIALSPDERPTQTLRDLFSYRFDKGAGLDGHSFGNLFLTALTEITGGADKAIAEAGRILGIVGQVLPVTLTNAQLCARLEDGSEIVGEANIDVRKAGATSSIDYVYLTPKALAHPPAVQALEEAAAIVIGPGDLYTSLIPNLLVEGVPEAIERSRAKVVFVCNLMTKRGESDGYKASDFVGEANIDVRKASATSSIDYVYLTPKAFAHPPAVQALEEAAAIVIGPGDLYTSLIPNLLVEGVPEAIERSPAKVVFVCNLMTKRGESDGYRASDFVGEVLHYLGPRPRLDYVILNNASFPQRLLRRYALQHAHPVESDVEACRRLVRQVVEAPMLAAGTLLRHDADKLAATIMQIAKKGRAAPVYARKAAPSPGARQR